MHIYISTTVTFTRQVHHRCTNPRYGIGDELIALLRHSVFVVSYGIGTFASINVAKREYLLQIRQELALTISSYKCLDKIIVDMQLYSHYHEFSWYIGIG